MKNNFPLLAFFFFTQLLSAQNVLPKIHAVSVTTADAEQYGKFEATVDLTATYTNPYDYDEVAVSGVFTDSDGNTKTVDGFFMRDYTLNESTGNLTATGNQGVFKIRFSPDKIGNYTYVVSVTDQNGTTAFDQQSFACIAPTSNSNKGFIRSNNTNYLHFDNGQQYIPVGENIAWQSNNVYLNYKSWLSKLHNNGGNFFRLWHAHWGLGIEWKNGWQSFAGLRKYKETNSFYQDWMFDYCADNDIYVMLCIQHHGQVSSQVNPNWNDSPYNAVNGGPCLNTWDFFTNATAIAHTKNRLRYIVARWGYARSILTWELFNEVEWTDNFAANEASIASWHAEMAAYLKTIDPYQHLVTTSYAQDQYGAAVWGNPDFDFSQTHFYINTSNIERALVNGIHTYLEDFEKPTLNGEFGLGGNANLANEDPNGVHIHNSLWATLYGGGMGSAMTWWWDNYIDPRNLYYHFAPVSTVAQEIPFLDQNMKPATSYVKGAPGDLILTPTLGWAGLGDEDITINANGTLTPANAALCTFLYSSNWNNQFRRAPNFSVNYPADGTFTVRTSSDTGTDPAIAIYLDGNQVLSGVAQTNTSYQINVPAGAHTIKVDNTGTDWITIASYTFSGLGSKMDSYVLTSENKDVAAGWVLNNSYNHQFIAENGIPDAATGGIITIEGFETGSYAAFWYDCLTGELKTVRQVWAENNQLKIPVPELYWDLSFFVKRDPLAVKEVRSPLDFKVFPNPARPGSIITIQMDRTDAAAQKISLRDMNGKLLSQSKTSPMESQQFALPEQLPAGLYWISIEGNGIVGSQPILVVQ